MEQAKLVLGKREYIVTAWADPARYELHVDLVNVLIRDNESGKLRIEHLTPDMQTPTLKALICLSDDMSNLMASEALKAFERENG